MGGEKVQIQFLGSGDARGSGGRLQTCIAVRSGGACFLIDCGASSLVGMKRFGFDPSSVETVLLTHLHGDHFGGIPSLILEGQFTRRTSPLLIAGPAGVESRVREAMEVFFPGSSAIERRFPVRFIEWEERKSLALGPLTVTPYTVIHPSGSPPFALRIESAGKVIAYSGDTEWTDALLDAARDADLFIAESYYFEKKIKFHLDYKTLMDHRTELGCRRIVLTHMGPDLLQRLGDIAVEWAEDGKTFEL
jgi:ribonuclease BN (tRNA processing enzyme)